jgi:hypothetical protein
MNWAPRDGWQGKKGRRKPGSLGQPSNCVLPAYAAPDRTSPILSALKSSASLPKAKYRAFTAIVSLCEWGDR